MAPAGTFAEELTCRSASVRPGIFFSQFRNVPCAVEEEWGVVFEHDAHTAAATIGRNSKGHFELGRVWGAHGLENLEGDTGAP